jgi:hypothetical protein
LKKIFHKKRAGVVAQAVNPEFNSKYCKKKDLAYGMCTFSEKAITKFIVLSYSPSFIKRHFSVIVAS